MSDPTSYTPQAINDLVTRLGGTNDYGKPMWRLVLSERRLHKTRGTWHTFADGTLEQFSPAGYNEKGEAVFNHNPMHALSVVTEVRETPMWPHSGWILERWMPAWVWGTKADWDPDGGEYPSQGDYFMILGPFTEVPNATFLEAQINLWTREWNNRPTDFAQAYKVFIADKEERERRENAERDANLDAFYKGEIQPIFKSGSLEAQRLRQKAGEAAGIKSHIAI